MYSLHIISRYQIFTEFHSSHKKFLYSTVFEGSPHLPLKVVPLSLTLQSPFSHFTHLNKGLTCSCGEII